MNVQIKANALCALFFKQLLLLFSLGCLASSVYAAPVFTTGASMAAARSSHTTTLLPNGKVLVVGGWTGSAALASAEIYDPAGNSWSSAGTLNIAREGHTATLLPNGKVLIVGGLNSSGTLTSNELYDPASNSWSNAIDPLKSARYVHTATLLPNGKVLVVGGLNGSALVVTELYDPASNSWSTVNTLNTGRHSHTATLLQNGRVLVAGGSDGSNRLASAEIYDLSGNSWSFTANSLTSARLAHVATLLPSGKVLIAGGGGNYPNNAELYDPASNSWSSAGSMSAGRYVATATLLPNGQVLVVGGDSGGGYLNNADLYDPTGNAGAGTWSTVGSMATPRYTHSTTLLPNGRLLVVGGRNGGTYLASTELIDTAVTGWSGAGSLTTARYSHTSTLLPNGKILIAGGTNTGDGSGHITNAELYDPAGNSWSPAVTLGTGREAHSATLLPNGKVLIVGGFGDNLSFLATAELYDPVNDSWSPANSLLGAGRYGHTATLLANGKVLVAGGHNLDGNLTITELYDPAGNSWSPAGNLNTGRSLHTAILLPNGKVLVAGGQSIGAIANAELYDPALNSWSVTGTMNTARQYHTATLLQNGKVLVAGGQENSAALASAEVYDPADSGWTLVGSLNTARRYQTATLLPNGRVLISGGFNGSYPASAELYNPDSYSWNTVGNMATGHHASTATLLPNGKVLVVSGLGSSGSFGASAELFDPGMVPDSSRQPVLSNVTASIIGSTALVATGSGFRPNIEASDGSAKNSATNFPLIQVTRVDNGQTRWLTPDPAVPFSETTFTSTANALAGWPTGHLRVTAYVNGIPSASQVVLYTAAVDQFSFSAISNAQLSTAYQSNSITVTGIAMAVPISITAGGWQYAVSSDSGTTWSAWTAVAGIVNLNDQVKVMQISSASANTTTSATLTIGGVDGAFAVTTTETPVAASLPAGNLVSLWRAENNALDSVGSNHGSWAGTAAYGTGVVGKAFSLDGNGSYISVTDDANLHPTTAITLQAWIKPEDIATDQHIISTAGGGPSPFGHDYYLRLVSGSLEFRINDDPLWAGSVIPAANRWYHVTATYDRATGLRKIYVDGALTATNGYSSSINTGHTTFSIGVNARNPALGSNFNSFKGSIDEVAIYSRELTATEIQTYYQNTAPTITLPFREEFNGAVHGAWVVTNPEPAYATLAANPGNLRLMTTDTDPIRNYNTTKNLFTIPLPNGANNYQVTAKLALPTIPTLEPQQAGIILLADNTGTPDQDNYLRIMYAYENGARRVELVREESGVATVVNTTTPVELDPNQPIWLRMLKSGTAYTLQYSLDGQSFFTFYSLTGNWSMAHAGIFAIHSIFPAYPQIPVDFDFFDISVIPVTPPVCATVPPGLVSWWTGDGTTNDLAAQNNGILNGSVQFVGGKVGQAFSFNGVDQYVSKAAPVNLPVGGSARTISAWIWNAGPTQLNGPPTHTFQTIIGYGSPDNTYATSGKSFMLEWGGNDKDRNIGLTGWQMDTWGTTFLNYNQWYHVAATYDGTTVRLYLNGAFETSAAWTLDTVLNGEGVLLGNAPANDGWHSFFNGLIDEPAIFDRVLTQTEINSLYQAGETGMCKGGLIPLAGQIAWWRGEGNIVDSTAAYNGSLGTGSALYSQGIFGKALDFDGTSCYEIPNGLIPPSNHTYSIEALVYPRVTNMVFYNSPSGGGGEVTFSPGGIGTHLSTLPTDSWQSASSPLTYNAWTHRVGVRENGVLKLWDKGVQVATTTLTGSEAVSGDGYKSLIGCWYDPFAGGWKNYYSGLVDELRVYSRVLSADEISLRSVIKSITTPDAFAFNAESAAMTGSAYESNTITVSGINDPTAISIGAIGQYAILPYGSAIWGGWTTTTGTVRLGDKVKVMTVSSSSASTATTATLTIGGVSADFIVTTTATLTRDLLPLNGLVSLWRAENNALDSIGVNHGALQGGASYAEGKTGQAFSFNGTGYVERTSPDGTLNIGNQSWTISAWVKSSSTVAAIQSIVSRYECGWTPVCNYTNVADYGLMLTDAGYARFSVRGSTGDANSAVVTDSVDLRDGSWHLVTGVLDRSTSTAKIYVDGQIRNTITSVDVGDVNDPGSPLEIGRIFRQDWGIPGYYFNGLIDDVAIYNRALTATEIGYFATAPPRTGVVRAYIPNQDSNSITVIDPSTGLTSTISGTIQSPYSIAVSPDGTKAYIAGFKYSGTSNGINVIDVATGNQAVWSLFDGYNFYGIAISPDGKKLYAAVRGGSVVLAISTADGSFVAIPGFNNPSGLVVTPDNSKVYVSNYGSSTIKVITTSDNSTAEISDASLKHPWGIAASPDGTKVYVANETDSNVISVISTATDTVTATIPLGGLSSSIAVSPNGATLYAGYAGTVYVIDTASSIVVKTISVGSFVEGISITPDGTRVIVTNSGSNTATIIDTAGNLVVNSPATELNPRAFGNFIAAPPAVTNGLVSLWRGEGNTFDVVGGNNGTAVGGASYKQGVSGSGFSFDGTGKYIEMSNNVGDFGSTQFAVSFWMNDAAGTYSSDAYLVGKSDPNGGAGWDIRVSNNTIKVAGVDGWGFNITSDASVTSNVWHHITLSATSTDVYLYIDGVLKGTSPRSTISSTVNPFRVGYTTNYGGSAFNGLIDEVSIYNRALVAAEVAALFSGSDITPNQFNLAAVIDTHPLSPQTSNTITVTGITAATPISISGNGGEYSIGCTETFVSTPGTISNTETVCVRQASSSSYGTTVSTTLTIGGVSSTFNVTTKYSVTFDSNGGSAAIVQAINYNGTATTPADPTKTGYTFTGWYSNPDLSSTYNFSALITANIVLYAKWTINRYLFSVSVPASSNTVGVGSVSGNPGPISCSSGNAGTCSETYDYNTSVSLSVTATNSDSTFTGWGGDCTGTAACSLTVDAAKNVIANFGFGPNLHGPRIKIGSVGFDTLNDAYNAIITSGTIRSINGENTIGTLLMDRNVDIVLEGGYNPFFTHVTSLPSVLLGTLKISNGTLRVKGITIKQ
jgi:uncharacterized repeat protein (TIGR02543 family)